MITGNQISEEIIVNKIYVIRGQRVMIDRDLAEMYGVETRVLNQAVKRNEKRFPIDFMFQLNHQELSEWKSQNVISKKDKMGLRTYPTYSLNKALQCCRVCLIVKQLLKSIYKSSEFLRVFVKC